MITIPRLTLTKLRSDYSLGTVTYQFVTPDGPVPITPESKIRFTDSGDRFCISCNRKTNKIFGQGFCYPCFMNSPENAECIVRPELCRAHEGIGRDPDWEARHHNQPHTVYLANSAGLKVGITRDTQIPTRWIDQGAIEAIVLARVPYRYLAGCIEVSLKPFMSDKTPWQKMIRGLDPELDLTEIRRRIRTLVSPEHQAYLVDEPPMKMVYPVLKYPEVAKSVKLDNSPEIEGTVTGIRGQYLLLDGNRALNVRNHSGYSVRLTINPAG
ncbi:DUF2797 domain-containing protein [bacterium]|nr:DUF2797 domain-containing protein [bacterium]